MRETKTKHTPGPWMVWPETYSYRDLAAEREFRSRSVFGNNGDAEVAICDLDTQTSEVEAEANARLIAAAPELLSVAEAIAAKGSGCEDCQECRAGDIWWDARAAIAKATGGES